MIPDVARELAPLAAAWLCAAAAGLVTLRARALARSDREALRSARERESAFVEIARRLAGAARESVDAVRDEIARGARVVAPAVDGVLLYDEYEGVLRCSAAYGTRFAYFAGTQVALDDPAALAARAVAAAHRVRLGDVDAVPPHPGDVDAVGVPLAVDAGRSCVMVASATVALTPEAVDRLVALADQASPAYLIALDREHDRRRAEYDGLTGLLTPRAFRQQLSALVERARFAPTTQLVLLFVDTDRFKLWNDAFGHAAGDALLQELSRLLRGAVRLERDLVARNGGDEFCIVFTDTDKATAIERAELLRVRIAALDCRSLRPDGATVEVRITASIGVAALPADATSASDLLERADAAMYHAKQTGRDGVAYVELDGGYSRLRLEERD
ncbi:MAG TPA: GGDEF domain-containing protein [Candidatus Elarobacter sp.]|nr:GGDEF domain-containing protein [Candidatus Elarobacter sp.]